MEEIVSQLREQFQLPLQNPVLVFALILLIILLVPIVLRRLRVPGIIGLILAGMVVGPNGFDIISKTEAVDLFATIGVLYLMFIAGLELELSEFKKNSQRSILFGILTFSLPFLVGLPVCYLILGFDLLPSILVSTMFSAHTMIAYPIVTKVGISRDPAVALTVGGTIITDTAVLIVLAVITGSHDGGITPAFVLRITSGITLFLLFMTTVVPRMAKWFFTRLEGEKASHYIFVLAIVFSAAFLSQLAGLEPIIGAFMAGLVLNKLIPPSSLLMNRIQFVGNALFIPFFILSVGMLIDIRSALGSWKVLYTAGVITLIAIVGKFLAAFVTQKVYHFTRPQGLLIFGLSVSRVAATLAVVLVAYEAGIIDKTILEATILLILVTCLVAAVVTEYAARERVAETGIYGVAGEEPEVHESILIPVAFLKNLESLLDLAHYVRQSGSFEPVRVLSVVPANGLPDSILNTRNAEVTKHLTSLTLPEDLHAVSVVIADQNIASGINRISRELEVTLIILGWSNRETFSERIFGQKTEQLLNNSEKTIMVTRLLKPLNTFGKIVLFAPPLSELEPGFDYLIRKIVQMSLALNLPMQVFSNTRTQQAFNEGVKKLNRKPQVRLTTIVGWDEMSDLMKRMSLNDLHIVLSTRKGSVSYHPQMDHLFDRCNTICPAQSVIITYPTANLGNDQYDKYRDFYAEPLTRSMETFRNIQRGMEKMIHKAE